MSTQLQAIGNFSVDQVETIRNTIAKDATPEQFGLFIRTAAAAGLNPLLNHIYCIVYGGKMSIQVSVEGILYLAKRVEGYQGIDTQLVHENDEFKASRVKDDQGRDLWSIEKHEITYPRGKVIGCYSVAYRDGFRPYMVFMEVDEVQHHLTGNNAGNWKKYFNDFFKKTVTKRAAKGQFGIEITEDEGPINGVTSTNFEEYSPSERRDITAEANANITEQPAIEKPKDDGIKAIRKKITAAFKKLGITDKEAMAEYTAQRMKQKGDEPTFQELTGLLKVMEMEIEEQAAMAEVVDGLEPLE